MAWGSNQKNASSHVCVNSVFNDRALWSFSAIKVVICALFGHTVMYPPIHNKIHSCASIHNSPLCLLEIREDWREDQDKLWREPLCLKSCDGFSRGAQAPLLCSRMSTISRV